MVGTMGDCSLADAIVQSHQGGRLMGTNGTDSSGGGRGKTSVFGGARREAKVGLVGWEELFLFWVGDLESI